MTLRAFITNLSKYNDGELVGQWVDFPCDKDDFDEVLKEIGIDEYHEEWFAIDYECDIDEVAQELGEYSDFDELNRVAEALEEWDGGEELGEAVINIWGVDELLNSTPDDYLYFEANDDEDIGYYYAEGFGFLNEVPENLRNYFDYEAYGRDIRIDTDSGLSDNGYFVERI